MAIEISLTTLPLETWQLIRAQSGSDNKYLDEYLLEMYGAIWKPGSMDV